ncbi:MAG: BACON domain-containing protein [Clostridia bacterium]|nr:BACON domain-containing protein [Clostridia bacterium]
MRKTFFLCLFTFVLLLFLSMAAADVTVVMDTPSVSLGETVLFHVEGTGGEIRYDIYRSGELLFRTGFVTAASGAYIPTASGNYFLRVTDRSSGMSAQRDFTVTGDLKVTLNAADRALSLGEAAEYAASAEGGSPPFTYTFSVRSGSERIYGRSGSDPAFSYTTNAVGAFTVTCTVTDSQNASASASAELRVEDGPGISAESDDTGPFRLWGGVRRYTVHSPGIWTAETDADFLELSTNCGGDGTEMFVTVLPGREPRRGTITLHSGSSKCVITVTRLSDDGIEKEVSLSSSIGDVSVDGESMAVWAGAHGEKEFAVLSDSDWVAVPSDGWIRTEYTENGLKVSVDDCSEPARAGHILIENDMGGTACLSVCQSADSAAPDVTAVSLSQTMGISYEDSITAFVRVDGEADQITVYRISGSEPVAASGASGLRSDGTWTVTFPLEGTGEESYLFAASREGLSGRMMIAHVSAFSEQASFNDLFADAELDGELCTVTVQMTSSIASVLMLDENGREMGMISAEDADIDRYIDENNRGRFSQWTFTVPSDRVPAALRIGTQTLEVVKHVREYPNLVFSQFDGTWDRVKYRHSNLQDSGCAVFTLASALRKLGFVSENASPAALADKYSYCLVDGGTLNSTLVGNAARDFGFRTRYDLYNDRESVEALFAKGAIFSFSIVKGHIALADAISEDGSMIHIVDSAMSATFSRLNNAQAYIRLSDGSFSAVSDPSQVPGALYYIETESWSGGEYWLEAPYVLRRGVRLLMNKE